MREINMDKVACPNCGTSGAENLDANSQIEYTGHVDTDGWIACPDCGSLAEFTEDGDVTKATVVSAFKWAVVIVAALDGMTTADAMNAGEA